MKKIIPISIMLLLAGCSSGDSDIKQVQSTYIDPARTLTVSQLLDNRSACEETSWISFKNEREQKVVKYSCLLKGSEDFYKEPRDKFLEKAMKEFDSREKHFLERIDELQRKIDSNYDSERKLYVKAKEEYEEALTRDSTIDNELIIRYKDIVKNLEGIKKSKNKDEAINYLVNFKTSESDFHTPHILSSSFLIGIRQDYERMLLDKEDPSRIERRNHANRFGTIDYDPAYLLDNKITFFISDLDKIIMKYNDAINNRLEAAKSSDKSNIIYKKEALDIEKRSLDGVMERTPVYLDEYREKLTDYRNTYGKEKIREGVYKNKYPYYSGAYDSFEWIVNSEGKSSLVSGVLYAKKEDGSTDDLIKFIEPANSLVYIYNIGDVDEINVQKYIEANRNASLLKLMGY